MDQLSPLPVYIKTNIFGGYEVRRDGVTINTFTCSSANRDANRFIEECKRADKAARPELVK